METFEIGMILLFVAMALGGWFVFTYNSEPDIQQRIRNAQGNVGHNMSAHAASEALVAATNRRDLAMMTNMESVEYLQMQNMRTSSLIAEYENLLAIPRAVRQEQLQWAIVQNQHRVIQEANRMGLSPGVYEQLIVEREKIKAQVGSEVDKHFIMQLIDFEVKKLTAGLQKEMLQFRNLLPHHELAALNKRLSKANRELETYRRNTTDSPLLKERELRRLARVVKTLQGDIRERKRHLLRG